MSVRCVILASVSSVFLAASVAVSGSAYAAQGNPGSIQAEEAYRALSSGDPEMAIANYSLAIDSNNLPSVELASALLNRALAYQQTGQIKPAIADYSAAIKLDSLSTEQRYTAMYNRGLAHQKSGSAAAAIDDFTGALYLKPDLAQAYFARGDALRASGQNLFALSDFDKALHYAHPDKARVYFAQSQAYEALKRPAEARQALALAAAANPRYQAGAQKVVANANTGNDVPATDPLLTASAAPIGGSVTLKKPDMPKAIQPPADMVTGEDSVVAQQLPAAQAPQPAAAQPPKVLKVAAVKAKKKYLDRILPEANQAEAPALAEKVVAVEPADNPELAETATASIEPAAAPAGDAASDEEARPTSAAQLTGWTVQVASAASEDAALSTYKKMQSRRNVLKGMTPTVVRADLGSKGVFYRVRFGGYDSQKAAQKACSKLKSKGVSCYVSLSSS